MNMDVKALIRAATLPEATERICLRADLVAEYERVERELNAAKNLSSKSLDGRTSGPAAALEDRLAELREQMQASTVTFTLRALPSPKYRALVEEHPPRIAEDKVDRRDVRFGFNVDTLFDALVRACTVSPELDDEDWDLLIGENGKLSDAQVEKLSTAAWQLNRRDVDLPF